MLDLRQNASFAHCLECGTSNLLFVSRATRLPVFAELLDTDTNWRFTRGRSVILQNFQDEIAPAKHKAAKTLVHKLEWQPYGDRVAEDTARSSYTTKLTRFVKQLLDNSTSSNKQLLKVPHLHAQFC